MSFAQLFKWRHVQANIILFNVRWYLRYGLNYRDLEEMMRERGIEVSLCTCLEKTRYTRILSLATIPFGRHTVGGEVS